MPTTRVAATLKPPLVRAAMDNRLLSAKLYDGVWADVGTPERLQQLNGDQA